MNRFFAVLTRRSPSYRDTLRKADLIGVSLTRAFLTGADLTGARLRGANLSGANLSGAHLEAAILAGAQLSKDFDRSVVHFDEETIWP